MADAGMRRASRAGFTAAGYVCGGEQERENELYIERVQAGSAQDLLRDNNRIGYDAEELDGDGLPFSFLMEEAQRDERRAQKAKKKAQSRPETLGEKIAVGLERERGAMVICCALAAVIAVLGAFYIQAMIDSVRKRDVIEYYKEGIASYERDISECKMTIAKAQDGERVRNVAQNEMGMLRKERVNSEKIYIQTTNLNAAKPAVPVAQEERNMLDWLLSVADIFDLKS